MEPSVAIVVPTLDRPLALRRCLDALRRQDTGPLEVVVVDDGSRDPLSVAREVERYNGAQALLGAGRGPAAARNLGARAASGDVILFTDDDCEPAPAWARLLSAAARHGAAAGVTTNVAPGPASQAAQVITNHLQRISGRPGGATSFAPTCNLGVAAELLERVPFDESFPAAGGEDRDWCARAVAAAGPIAIVPEAVVEHRHEMGPLAFLRQQLRYGRGAARFRSMHPPSGEAPGAARAALGFVRAGFRDGPGVGTLVCAAQLAAAVGFALERQAGRG